MSPLLVVLYLALLLSLSSVQAYPGQIFQSPEIHDSDNIHDGMESGYDQYRLYSGDGSPRNAWPSMDQWASFEDMWQSALPSIQQGCTLWGLGVADNSPYETQAVHDAIQDAASLMNVDRRFILAVLMQESNGCVRVRTTNNGNDNPGLMQSHAGPHTCFAPRVRDPCPRDQIAGMVLDGVVGTPSGDGLAAILARQRAQGYAGAQMYYRAARVYNSGSVAGDNVLEHGGATHCYVSSVANRLVGWSGNTDPHVFCCPWDEVAGSGGGAGAVWGGEGVVAVAGSRCAGAGERGGGGTQLVKGDWRRLR